MQINFSFRFLTVIVAFKNVSAKNAIFQNAFKKGIHKKIGPRLGRIPNFQKIR